MSWQYKPFVSAWLIVWAALYLTASYCNTVLVIALACAALYLADLILKSYDIFAAQRETFKDVKKKGVLITGCDTGFGNKLAHRLAKMGFQVYATCLMPEGEDLVELVKNERVSVIKMNVTKQEDVEETFKVVQDHLKTNGLELWSIVNNAGIGVAGQIEFLSIESYKKVMEVNTFAPVLVTKTFLPLLRANKRGRVVNVASQAGRFSPFAFSPYSMSKHATVSFSDGLRQEMKKWNITVHTIEPGLFKTNIINLDGARNILQHYWQLANEEIKDAYGNIYYQDATESFLQMLSGREPACKLYKVIDDLVDAVAGVNPKVCYIPTTKAKMLSRVIREVPFEVSDALTIKRGGPATLPAAVLL